MAMVAVTAALIGFFAFVIMRVTTPQMTTLFTDLSVEDSAGIVKDLERQAIPFELRNDGAVIMVPKDKVTRLRMKLAEGGLPKGGGVGYEIFDKSDALGTTSFVQNINHLRALEGELARTIRAIDRIQAAPASRSGCAVRSRRSCRRWSAPAAPASSSRPTSTTTRSPRPRTASIPRGGCCARARPGKNPQRPPRATLRSPSTTSCPAIRT